MTGCLAPRIGTQFHRRAVTVPMPAGVQMFPAYLREAGYYTTNNQKKDYNAVESPGTWDESSRQASWRNREAGQPFFHMQSFTTTHESSLHFSQQIYENEKTQTDPQSVAVQPYFPDTELFRYTIAKYHDNIQKVDLQIGSVVDQLAEDGLLDDTFIFYFGDHGGVLPRGKGYAYESGLHVPLVVYTPKNFQSLVPWERGATVGGFVQFIDFGTTVLQLAGVASPSGIDGSPFMGTGVTAEEVGQRDEAFGYADRFDEKYDLVRTLRKGRYEYIRNYQPFNFDGLQNNYRYIMLAYQQWRSLYQQGKLNPTQSQFFKTRPAEQLFDIDSDPHEVHDLAQDPQYQEVLEQMRQALATRVKALPDLSFFPESELVERGFENPVAFGRTHADDIARMVDIADLCLQPFAEVREALVAALQSDSSTERYWAAIACTSFGAAASSLRSQVRPLLDDQDPLVRVRAAEFLALVGDLDPRPVLMQCLKESASGVQANLILNSIVMLKDGDAQVEFSVAESDLHPQALEHQDVRRRLAYLQAEDGIPDNPQGRRRPRRQQRD